MYISDDFQAAVHKDIKKTNFILDLIYIPDISCPLCLSYLFVSNFPMLNIFDESPLI